MRPSLSFRVVKTGVIACLLGLIPVAAQPPILCIGDSLTKGQGGLESPWPSVLAQLSGIETLNRGRPGWIPRHLTYAYLLQDCFTLTTDDLRVIPPLDRENRVNQPEINNTRTIIANGQRVIASDAAGHRAVYRWDSSSTAAPSASVIQPEAVGNPDHLPPIATGRWLRLDETPAEVPPANRPRICVAWIGANGMESDDVITSLHTIETRFKAGGGETFLVLGLLNRMPPTASAKSIAGWARLIDSCNAVIQADYPAPARSLDLQSWFTSSGPYLNGGYQTVAWFPQATAEEIAADRADQQAGVVPRSLRPPTDKTHLNGTGYTIVGHLVYQALQPVLPTTASR
jgi:lysophospholipase L1-like esterase